MTDQASLVVVGDDLPSLDGSERFAVTPVESLGGVYGELETSQVDCIVCDADGVDWRALWDDLGRRFDTVPFVLYGDTSDDRIDRAREAGVDAFVPREAGRDYLTARLCDVLADRHEETALSDRANARFQTITENTGVAIVTIDTDSIVQFANPTVEDVLGWEPSTLEGEPITRVVPDRLRAAHFEGMREYLEDDEPTLDWSGVRLPALHAEGHEVPVFVSFGEFDYDGRRYFSGVIAKVPEETVGSNGDENSD